MDARLAVWGADIVESADTYPIVALIALVSGVVCLLLLRFITGVVVTSARAFGNKGSPTSAIHSIGRW